MGRFKDLFKHLFASPPSPADSMDADALRIDFKQRYHNFKLLLGANNKALEIMAEMEAALKGGRPFGMAFIRAGCTAVSVNVYRMVRKLDLLAPGVYAELFQRYDNIQNDINALLSETRAIRDDRLVIPLDDVDKDMADLVGGKMANLGEMKNRIGLDVPEGFVITAAAYERFLQFNDLQAEIDQRFQTADLEDRERLFSLCADIQQMIIRAGMPPEIAEAVERTLAQLKTGNAGETHFALRSSALGEDSAASSFAGQYRSILNVGRETLFAAYKEVVASKYGVPAVTYRMNRGFRDRDIGMSVGCLVMVDAAAGGVIYSRNPVDARDNSIFVNSAWGLPKSVVDGSVDCDLFVVSRSAPMAIVGRDIRVKDRKYVCYPEEGVCRMDLTDDARFQASLTDDQAIALAKLAVKIEDHYGTPQDIEWALPAGETPKPVVLQCRPLKSSAPAASGTALAPPAVGDGPAPILAGGLTVSPGTASGRAFFTDRGIDILEFPEGGILVVRQALPRWAPVLDRAAAVLAEKGGFAGHLANVCREFEVPAIFGLDGVMEKIEPGALITVDADGRRVYLGRIESLLVERMAVKNLMENSPVYETLRKVSRLVVPLNLLDPDAPEFRPAKCRTLHDITRFIHEKSVHEMFNFGKAHNFPERSAKQLFFKVPMQWWVLNLDDGFTEEVTGKYVKLENIASIPMLALWDGIVAIRWEGPPIDGRGLASVMFHATANPDLNTGAKSKYTERNYFMISKHYCSLNSRLGFHFSILEALVGDRPTENYISFSFKGGAADPERRVRRVVFVGDLLTQYGFKTNIKEDNLSSRLEGHEADFMQDRLKILGYLTLHTRQLDMIMGNPRAVRQYQEKFRKDIDSFIRFK